VLLERHARSDERDGRPDGELPLEQNCGGVHRDRSDDGATLTVDQHLGAGQVTPEPVGIADRENPDPRVGGGHEQSPVTG
jgi:hypothetical protein